MTEKRLYDTAKAAIDFCWSKSDKQSEFYGLWKGASVIANSTEFIHLMYELYEAVQDYRPPLKIGVRVRAFFKRLFGWKIVISKR
jgi:hypothetical protein